MAIDLGTLLYSGYDYDGLKLDLYGRPATEDEGHVVVTATLVGSKLSLAWILQDDVLDEMGEWLDGEMPRLHRAENLEAKAARVAYDRMMSMFDHKWRSL